MMLWKAPLLNGRRQVPLEVPPSGNTMKGGYSPFCSIRFCLSWISSTTFYSSSGVPPREMKIHPRAFAMTPAIGVFLSSFFAAKPQPKKPCKRRGSNHDAWLLTIVEMCAGRCYVFL